MPHFGWGLAAVHREAQPGQLLTQTPVHALADRLPALAARLIVAVGEGGLVVILLGTRGGGQRREEQGGEAWHVALPGRNGGGKHPLYGCSYAVLRMRPAAVGARGSPAGHLESAQGVPAWGF